MKKECIECGAVIPPARVKLTKSDYCVQCAQQLEKEGLVPRYRMEIYGNGDTDNFELQTKISKIAPKSEASLPEYT